MTVESVISSEGLLTTDDQGGYRIASFREFPPAMCFGSITRIGCDGVPLFDTAKDARGRIVEFVRDDEGLPSSVRFGESLLLRYDFTPPLRARTGGGRLSDRWRPPSSWKLIDLRTAEVVTDSVDAANVAVMRPAFSVFFRGIAEVLRFETGHPFAVAYSRRTPYALLPLEAGSEVWRSVYANGDMSWECRFRVDYTEDLVRVQIRVEALGRSIVVEAPRSLNSTAPIAFVHPGPDRLTDAMRSDVRLRVTESPEPWLRTTFDKTSLPIVLDPFHSRGLEIPTFDGTTETDLGVIREAVSTALEFDFGPGEGCREEAGGILCVGGESEVIGRDVPHPLW